MTGGPGEENVYSQLSLTDRLPQSRSFLVSDSLALRALFALVSRLQQSFRTLTTHQDTAQLSLSMMTCLFRYTSRGVFIHTMWSTWCSWCKCDRPTYQLVTLTRFENSLESFVRVSKHFYSKCIFIHHSFGMFSVKGGSLWNWKCAHPIMHVIMHVWARNNPVKHYVWIFR